MALASEVLNDALRCFRQSARCVQDEKKWLIRHQAMDPRHEAIDVLRRDLDRVWVGFRLLKESGRVVDNVTALVVSDLGHALTQP